MSVVSILDQPDATQDFFIRLFRLPEISKETVGSMIRGWFAVAIATVVVAALMPLMLILSGIGWIAGVKRLKGEERPDVSSELLVKAQRCRTGQGCVYIVISVFVTVATIKFIVVTGGLNPMQFWTFVVAWALMVMFIKIDEDFFYGRLRQNIEDAMNPKPKPKDSLVSN